MPNLQSMAESGFSLRPLLPPSFATTVIIDDLVGDIDNEKQEIK